MEYIAWTVVHLGLWSLMLISAFGIGRVLLRKHNFDSTVERIVFTTALGLGSAAFIIFLLGLAGLMYRGVLIGITIPWGLFSLVSLAREINVPHVPDLLSRAKTHPLRAAIMLALFIGGLAYWVSLLVGTQFPPTLWDSTDEHLVVAREFLAAHRPVAIPGIVQPVLPALNHALFIWGMALKDDILAQMIEHTFLMLTALGLYAWGRRRGSSWFGVVLGAFWLGNPIVLWLGEAAYVDLCLVCFVFLGVYALGIFWQKRDSRWWYLAMALLGMASGTKLSGLFFAAAGMVTGLIAFVVSRWNGKLWGGSKAGDQQALRKPVRLATVAVGWAVALVVLAPWYGFIFFHTGNPFWPAFTEYSRGVWGSPALVQSMKGFLSHAAEPRTIKSFLMLPLNWLRRPIAFGIGLSSALNPLIILWPLAWVAAVWNREVRWWTVWALGFTFYWFFSLQDLRLWLAALPLCGIAMLETFRWVIERTRTSQLKTAAYVLIAVFSIWWGVRYIGPVVSARRLPPVTAAARERYLARVAGYEAAVYVNTHAKRGDVVAVLFGSWLAYHIKPEVVDLQGLLQAGRRPSFHWPEDEQWVRWLESQNADWILVRYMDGGEYIKRTKADPEVNPVWPDYELVYSRGNTWVFLHKPVPPDLPRIIDSDSGKPSAKTY